MSLESATWATQLNTGNPQSSDPRSQGDDHLRLTKTVVQTELSANNKQWVYTGDTVTYISGTIFTIATDRTSVFQRDRRLKITGASTGTIYGTVTSSTFSSSTAVNIDFDSGSMSNETLTTYISPLTPDNSSLPKTGLLDVKSYWGAKGDGVTDDYAAFAAAIASGKSIYVPPGDYILGSPLVLGNGLEGYSIIGAGVDVSILRASHSDGAAIELKERFQRLESLTVNATDARKTGTLAANYGVLFRPTDATGENVHDASLTNIRIANQSTHGLVFSGSMFGIIVKSYRIEDNGGHAVVIDNGTIKSMTTTGRPGSIEFLGGHVNDNAGHAFKIGDDDGSTNIPLRIAIRNCDSFRNALDSGVRKTAHSFWVYGENCVIEQCGIGCANTAGDQTISALWLAGRDNEVRNSRFINPIQPPAEIGNIAIDSINSAGNIIENFMVSDMAASASANPAVVIDTSAVESVVKSYRVTEIAQTATPSKRTQWQRGNEHFFHGDYLYSDIRSVREISANDDTAYSVEFDTDPSAGVAVLAPNISAGESVIFHFRVGATPQISVLGATAAVETTTGALAGTTGSDAVLTVSAHTDKKLYIENRTGSTRNYGLTFLSMANGKVLPAEMDTG